MRWETHATKTCPNHPTVLLTYTRSRTQLICTASACTYGAYVDGRPEPVRTAAVFIQQGREAGADALGIANDPEAITMLNAAVSPKPNKTLPAFPPQVNAQADVVAEASMTRTAPKAPPASRVKRRR